MAVEEFASFGGSTLWSWHKHTSEMGEKLGFISNSELSGGFQLSSCVKPTLASPRDIVEASSSVELSVGEGDVPKSVGMLSMYQKRQCRRIGSERKPPINYIFSLDI